MTTVAFVGLGIVGAPMPRNLIGGTEADVERARPLLLVDQLSGRTGEQDGARR